MPIIHKKSKKAHDDKDHAEPKSLAIAYEIQRKNKRKMPMDESKDEPKMPSKPMPMDDDMDEMQGPMSMADMIRSKKKKQMFAEGGMVDLQENGDEEPNEFDDLNEMAVKKELYDDSQIDDQPMDSNEMGDDDLEADAHDMISKLRARMKMRRGI